LVDEIVGEDKLVSIRLCSHSGRRGKLPSRSGHELDYHWLAEVLGDDTDNDSRVQVVGSPCTEWDDQGDWPFGIGISLDSPQTRENQEKTHSKNTQTFAPCHMAPPL
jgi:hypothetical protein